MSSDDLDFIFDSDGDADELTLPQSLEQTRHAFIKEVVDGFKFSKQLMKQSHTDRLVKLSARGCKDAREERQKVVHDMMKGMLCSHTVVTEDTLPLRKYCLAFLRWMIPIIFGTRPIPLDFYTTEIYCPMTDFTRKYPPWATLSEYLPFIYAVIIRFIPKKTLPPPTCGDKRTRDSKDDSDDSIPPKKKRKTAKAFTSPNRDRPKKKYTTKKNRMILRGIYAFHLSDYLQTLDLTTMDNVLDILEKFPRPVEKTITLCVPEQIVKDRWMRHDEIITSKDPRDSQLFVPESTSVSRYITR
jgi:hypothetical protein